MITREQLQQLTDAGSWKNGQKYFVNGEVQARSRTSSTLYGKVSGSKDYQVSIQLSEQKIEPHCTCPAYRRNKYCKHVIATALAWIAEPDSFTFIDESQLNERKEQFKTKKVKKSKADQQELMTSGLELVEQLIQDITNQGFSMVSEQTIATFQELAEFVKSHKLRRLGNLLAQLKEELQKKEVQTSQVIRLLSDGWFTVAAIRAHEQGKLKDSSLLDDLVGKTWRKTELEKVEGLRLLELSFTNEQITEFRLETSVFIDLHGGQLYTDKQITPKKLKQEAKPSYAHVLEVTEAYLYPGASPRRIKLESFSERAVERADIVACSQFARTSVAEIEAMVRENKASLFPQPVQHVLFQPKEVMKVEDRWYARDEAGIAIPIEVKKGFVHILAGLESFLLFVRIEEQPSLHLQPEAILTLDVPTDISYLTELPVIRVKGGMW